MRGQETGGVSRDLLTHGMDLFDQNLQVKNLQIMQIMKGRPVIVQR